MFQQNHLDLKERDPICPPSSSSLLPPPLPLLSSSLSSSVVLFPKPYIFQAYRKDTKLFVVVVVVFHESFILVGAVSVDCGCAADNCSGINGFQVRTAGKPGSPCHALPLLSATPAVSVPHTPSAAAGAHFSLVSCSVFITSPVAVITPVQLG